MTDVDFEQQLAKYDHQRRLLKMAVTALITVLALPTACEMYDAAEIRKQSAVLQTELNELREIAVRRSTQGQPVPGKTSLWIPSGGSLNWSVTSPVGESLDISAVDNTCVCRQQ